MPVFVLKIRFQYAMRHCCYSLFKNLSGFFSSFLMAFPPGHVWILSSIYVHQSLIWPKWKGGIVKTWGKIKNTIFNANLEGCSWYIAFSLSLLHIYPEKLEEMGTKESCYPLTHLLSLSYEGWVYHSLSCEKSEKLSTFSFLTETPRLSHPSRPVKKGANSVENMYVTGSVSAG